MNNTHFRSTVLAPTLNEENDELEIKEVIVPNENKEQYLRERREELNFESYRDYYYR